MVFTAGKGVLGGCKGSFKCTPGFWISKKMDGNIILKVIGSHGRYWREGIIWYVAKHFYTLFGTVCHLCLRTCLSPLYILASDGQGLSMCPQPPSTGPGTWWSPVCCVADDTPRHTHTQNNNKIPRKPHTHTYIKTPPWNQSSQPVAEPQPISNSEASPPFTLMLCLLTKAHLPCSFFLS